ncbi:hypothetical protein KVF89_23185 [Nocardioides carbamazepini]|uniref:hypothetical protein n=1 Tax=Nocardioides carbamazepini TaxID=2854259 RepID=UPI00214A727B|nr:hypothetical protein [Nocardioides carbamazepini]MCR1785461.1 hypothetical protein [Nocardioides carbamazepini]
MSTDVEDEIATALETGYADEPALRAPADYVADGRRRLRNRRLGTGGAAALVVAAALAVALLPQGGASRTTPDRAPVVQAPTPATPAASATATAPESTEAPPERISDVLVRGQHAGYDGRGRLVLRPGWRVVREVPNPLRKVAPEASAGLVVTDGRQTYWYLLDHSRNGGGASWDPASKAYARFEEWLDVMVGLQRGTEPAAYVAFAASGDLLEPGVGVRILGQWPGPDLPGFAAPGEDSALAKVVVDGRTFFVLARRSPGGPTDSIPFDAALLPEPTREAFLAHAREAYASGEGLR